MSLSGWYLLLDGIGKVMFLALSIFLFYHRCVRGFASMSPKSSEAVSGQNYETLLLPLWSCSIHSGLGSSNCGLVLHNICHPSCGRLQLTTTL